MRSLFIIFFISTVCAVNLYSQGVCRRKGWLQMAEENKPKLTEIIKKPLHLVNIVKDASSFQGWKSVRSAPMDSLYNFSFKKKSVVVIDF